MPTRTVQIVLGLIKNLGLTYEDVSWEARGFGKSSTLWSRIYPQVCKMKPALLGIIIANGIGFGKAGPCEISLYQVHNKEFLNSFDSGRSQLRILATTAIIAKIYELLSKREDDFFRQFEMEEIDWKQMEEEEESDQEPETYTRVEYTEGPCGHHYFE
ncbi:MAG: hypothetical protein WC220_12305 [Pedobacter sp.]|jgi:hypothetical protein